ncbi:hypothetical protein MMC18_005134 [Xylographa bjoerkii]|nr:hypothetical protein [Xylographa bjoerkii]
MAYNAYNYSPYYQQQVQQPVASNGTGQSDQGNTNTPYYRSLADVPVQRIHTGATQYSVNATSENYGTGYTYPSYRSAAATGGENTQQATKAGAEPSSNYYDTASRPYTDTSALGSLAYASALGRDGNLADQNRNNGSNYRASATTSTSQSPYGSNTAAVSGHSQARSNSRGPGNTSHSNGQNNPAPVSPYAASIAANALAQTQQFSHTTSPQYQYRSEQPSSQHTHPTGQELNYHNKSASQSYTVGLQDLPSASTANAISLPPVQTTRSREPSRSSKPQYRPSAPAAYSGIRTGTGTDTYHSESTPYQAVPPTQQRQSQAASSTSDEPSHYGAQIHSRSPSTLSGPQENHPITSRHAMTTPAGSNQISSSLSQNVDTNYSTPLGSEQHPITVDPNQVFNVYEYQRRKAEAEAEAARKAAEQRSLQDQHATRSSDNVKQPTGGYTSAAGATSGPHAKQSGTETGSKDQIEAEIKAMIEKMREYKAKDPAVFSEVWERFKQVQPPSRALPQSLQTPKEPQGATLASNRDREIASPGYMDNGPLPSPSPVLVQHLTMSSSDSGNPPDLGRFPYQRRRRGKNDKGKSSGSRMSDVLNADDLGSSQLGTSVIDPRLSASNTPAVIQIGQQRVAEDPSQSEKTAQQDLQSFHRAYNSKRNTDHSATSYSSPYDAQTSKPGSGTIWPEYKKTALATVGKSVLESSAVNAGKVISVDDIRSMLDQNPSYDQLCQILESRGFVFERAEFARRLLDAVPNAKMDLNTTITTPESAKKPRRARASDSPRRPRGRPRKDGLPPRQSQIDQNKSNADSPAVSTSFPNGYVSASYGTSSRLETSQVPTAVQVSGDQILVSALQTAILQIDDEASRNAINDRPVANTGRPYMPIPRPPYTVDNNNKGSTSYSAGDAARDALKWSSSRQYSVETMRDGNKLDPHSGRIVQSIPHPQLLADGTHPGFGVLNVSGSQVNIGQIARGNIPQAPSSAEISTPTNLTKEQMARKRNFSEIVDLTQDIDEENSQEQKRIRLAQLNSLTSNNGAGDIRTSTHPHLTGLTAPEAVMTVSTIAAKVKDGTSSTPVPSIPENHDKIDLSHFRAPNSGIISGREALRLGEVVKELDKNDALKKSVYNVKTLARDILITKGIHPTERPLNWHLAPLRGSFRCVTNTSDLSTFRWDLIDPGGPKISHAARETETKSQKTDDETEKSAHIPIYAPTRERPRGRPPRSRGAVRGNPSSVRSLDAFRNDVTSLVRNMRPSRGGRGSRPRGTPHLQASTTRHSPRSTNFIDMTDGTIPSQMSPPPRPMAGNASGSSALQSSLSKQADHESANDRHQFGSDGSADAPMAPVTESGFTTSLVVRVPSLTSGLDQSRSTTPKSRGRPPGSTNKSSTLETGPKKRGRPVGSGTPSRGRPSDRGRPASYRTEVPEDGIGVLLPSRSPSTSSHLSHVEAIPEVEKKKGKRSRQAVTPSFQVFKCQWQGCGSELHNLETLRKHIFKLHGKAESSEGEASFEAVPKKIPCLWLGCEQEGVFSSTTGIMRFKDRDSWKAHIEKRHLETVAWELGDGPSTHPSDVEPSSYLSDSQGRTITPLARTTGPPDPLPPGSGPSPTRAYHRAHGNVTDHQKSQAELNSQIATKQVAGVFIGRDNEKVKRPQVENKPSEEESDSDNSSDL